MASIIRLFKFKKPGKYEPVKYEQVSSRDDISDASPSRTERWTFRRSLVSYSVYSYLIAVFAAFSFFLFGVLLGQRYPSDARCVEQLTIYCNPISFPVY